VSEVPPGWRERNLDAYLEICSCGHACWSHVEMPQIEKESCMIYGCRCRAYVGTDKVQMTMIEPIPEDVK